MLASNVMPEMALLASAQNGTIHSEGLRLSWYWYTTRQRFNGRGCTFKMPSRLQLSSTNIMTPWKLQSRGGAPGALSATVQAYEQWLRFLMTHTCGDRACHAVKTPVRHCPKSAAVVAVCMNESGRGHRSLWWRVLQSTELCPDSCCWC